MACTLINTVFNLDSQRAPHPSLQERQKQMTEQWGMEDYQEASTSNAAPQPQLLLVTQHRIAHLEQLALRILKIPHRVQNSPYVCTESTGPLPYLTDNVSSNHPPALIGRHHPQHNSHLTTADSKATPSPNELYPHDPSDILRYLRISHRHIEGSFLDQPIHPEMSMYLHLIQETLQPILEVKRITPNGNIRSPSEFTMSMNAGTMSKDHHETLRYRPTNIAVHPFAAFQYWAQTQITRRNSSYWLQKLPWRNMKIKSSSVSWNHGISMSSPTQSSTQRLVLLLQKLQEGYSCLDQYLSTLSPISSHPTLFHIVLYAHLCDAILDKDCLYFLSHHSNLYQFFQQIQEDYFENYTCSDTHPDLDWVQYNNLINSQNAFHPQNVFSHIDWVSQLSTIVTNPMLSTNHDDNNNNNNDDDNLEEDPSNIERMQKYIQWVRQENIPTSTANTFHRVRLGGSLYSHTPIPSSYGGYLSQKYLEQYRRWFLRSGSNPSDPSSYEEGGDESNDHPSNGEHWMKLQKRLAVEQDQTWMTFVVGMAGLVLILTSSKSLEE